MRVFLTLSIVVTIIVALMGCTAPVANRYPAARSAFTHTKEKSASFEKGTSRTGREQAPSPSVDQEVLRLDQEELEMAKVKGHPLFTTMEPLQAPPPAQAITGSQLTDLFNNQPTIIVASDEMPLPQFIHYVFSELLHQNFVMDQRIRRSKTPISLSLNRPVSQRELFEMIVDILKKNGIGVYYKNGTFYVWKGDKGGSIALGIGSREQDVPRVIGKVIQIVPLKFLSPQNLFRLLPREYSSLATYYKAENLLVLSGDREKVLEVLRIIQLLDRPAMRGRFIGHAILQYWSPEEMATKLRELLTEEGIPMASSPGERGLYFSPLERSNALLIFAAEEDWLHRANYWIKFLDIPQKKRKRDFFIYFPENSKAEELASFLGALFSPGKGSMSHDNIKSKKPAKRANTKETMGKQKALALTQIRDNLSFAVDEVHNALILFTTAEEFSRIRRLLRRLDLMPLQVLIQGYIAEITLTDNLQYGLEWYLKSIGGGQTTIIKTLGGLGLGSGGMTISTVTDTGKFQMVINALSQKQKIKILSSPRLVVSDGKSATITVGTDVPIITSEATTATVQSGGDTGIIRSVQYRTTGITLKVTPSVHAKGVVALDITQEVSEAQANTLSDISSPIILNRTIDTSVIIADGTTILLGGLIKENNSRTRTFVPVLGNIPIINYLFKTDSTGYDRTELVVMLTATIVHNTQDMEEILDKLRDDFRQLSPFPKVDN